MTFERRDGRGPTPPTPFTLLRGTGQQIACGVRQIEGERNRQVFALGRLADHDDKHCHEELAVAAAYFAQPCAGGPWYEGHIEWPFSLPNGARAEGPRSGEKCGCGPRHQDPEILVRIEQLAKAGALCAAEIDRLLRLPGAPK